ncbi:MAG TPA: ABC transporter transmembrane domain-containing protein, partial [Roseococcus sp.]|nr:ABC transporter transmembrane domain-containing protein [Roseococcus sp.]
MDLPNDTISITPASPRVAGLVEVARRLGVDLDRQMVALLSQVPEVEPPALVRCAEDAGLRAKAVPLGWRELRGLARANTPTLLLMRNGGAAVLDRFDAKADVVFLRDPLSPVEEPTAVDRARFEAQWLKAGIVVKLRRGADALDAPFNLRWLMREMAAEGRLFRDIGIATLIMAFLVTIPPLVLMIIADRVLLYQSWSTLYLLAAGLAVAVLYETMLGWAQRHLTNVAATRIDGRLQLFVMQRLLRLPLEFFERTTTGDIQSRIFSVYRVREFLTGQLFRTALDLTTLVVVVPLLILISPTLSFLILGLTVLMILATVAFLPRIGRLTRESVQAEIAKNTVLIETVQGIRTVKALAIEPQQADAWNERVAVSVERQRELVNASNQLQTLTAPIERLFHMGVLLFGTWSILNGNDSITMGSMFAFVMLSNRATGPLIAAAQLLNTLELVRTAMA